MALKKLEFTPESGIVDTYACIVLYYLQSGHRETSGVIAGK